MKDTFAELLGVQQKAVDMVEQAEQRAQSAMKNIEQIALFNQAKVLQAFIQNGVQACHMYPSTGYGYSDIGRDTLSALFAQCFGAEDALVRPQLVSGTHTISIALRGLLRPGDALCYITGKPYDTIEETIGIQKSYGSFAEYGIGYHQVELSNDNQMDIGGILAMLEKHPEIKVLAIQRSSGYAWRNSFSIEEIEAVILRVKAVRKDLYFFVDNCYGEFTEQKEPTQAGADVIAGSLIKNAGGGLAPTGGYICGTKEALEKIESALTTPGIGRECGSYEASYRTYYQGLFQAPSVVENAIKTAILFASVFSEMGYPVNPGWDMPRHDIIQAIQFNAPEKLIAFCQQIQSVSPVDSMAMPIPSEMPGYQHEVIMAAGTFVQGGSIELSADGPVTAPYIGYCQGGLTYQHGKIACIKALNAIL